MGVYAWDDAVGNNKGELSVLYMARNVAYEFIYYHFVIDGVDAEREIAWIINRKLQQDISMGII